MRSHTHFKHPSRLHLKLYTNTVFSDMEQNVVFEGQIFTTKLTERNPFNPADLKNSFQYCGTHAIERVLTII